MLKPKCILLGPACGLLLIAAGGWGQAAEPTLQGEVQFLPAKDEAKTVPESFRMKAHQFPFEQKVADLKNSSADYAVDLSAEPYEAKILSADFGGDATLVFDGYGMPDSGGTVQVQVGENVRTVVFAANTWEATVQ